MQFNFARMQEWYYDDVDLICDEIVISNAILIDGEEEETMGSEEEHCYDQEEARTIREGLSNLRLQKTSSSGLPKYDLQLKPSPSSVKKVNTKQSVTEAVLLL